MSASGHLGSVHVMTREEIVGALAVAFGPHLGWDGTHSVIDGHDDQGACTTSFVGADGNRAYRSLTYGEIADALAAAPARSAA